MTSPQHTVIREQISSIEEDLGHAYQFMHGASLSISHPRSSVSKALGHARSARDLLKVNLERAEELILTLERCQDFS